jgi:hypothetical protein
MSAERLAIGDLVRCSRCRKWHPAATWASGSAIDYAEKMLFIRCGTVRFFVGMIDGPARDPTAVKSPRGAGMRELTRSSDRPSIDDLETASVTAAARQVSLTRLNVLVIGPIAQTEAAVSAIVVALGKPARFWAPNTPVPARADGHAIVIRDIATLSPVLQKAWLAWLSAPQRRRPHIIATSSIAVFPLIAQGLFLEDLYYRLNTILLDLRASTGHE